MSTNDSLGEATDTDQDAVLPIAPLDASAVTQWDIETDVAVVGLGIAGTCAAISAH